MRCSLNKLLSLFGLFVSLSSGAAEKPKSFPAIEILRAIGESENKIAASLSDPSPLVKSLPEWDAEASPESFKSWMLQELPDEVLHRIENNVDQFGRPLL